MSRNLAEGLRDELRRCRELLEAYREIGPAGAFGAAHIEAAITEGEDAQASGDARRMIRSFISLKGKS